MQELPKAKGSRTDCWLANNRDPYAYKYGYPVNSALVAHEFLNTKCAGIHGSTA